MTTIYKYEVKIGDFKLDLPDNAEILTVQMQRGRPFMWAKLDTDEDTDSRYFTICGTGNPILDPHAHAYIGTFQDGGFVWHLFEIMDHK